MLRDVTVQTVLEVKDVRHKRSYILGFHLCNIFRIGKSTQTEQTGSSHGLEGWRMGSAEWVWVSVWGDETVLELFCNRGGGCTTL